MEPVVVLVVVTLILRALGAVRVSALRSWAVAVKGGLTAMFVMTGISHFIGMQDQLVAMVPPWIPFPELVVAGTGVLEIAGAIALWLPPLAPLAATGLTLLLLCIFPANVHLALNGGTGPDALIPRTVMQVAFLGATTFVAVATWRSWLARRAIRSRLKQ